MAGLLAAGLLFTAAYAQIELSLLFWARDCTRSSLFGYALPPSGWLALPGLFVLGIQPLLTRTTATLTRQDCEPSLLTRIQVGMLSGALGYLILVVAALLSAQWRAPVSPWWLVACFGALTLGELLVYPLGMALLTRLAPPRPTAVTMGLWLAALAGGHRLAGEVAARWAAWPHVALFATLAGMALAACAVLWGPRGDASKRRPVSSLSREGPSRAEGRTRLPTRPARRLASDSVRSSGAPHAPGCGRPALRMAIPGARQAALSSTGTSVRAPSSRWRWPKQTFFLSTRPWQPLPAPVKYFVWRIMTTED